MGMRSWLQRQLVKGLSDVASGIPAGGDIGSFGAPWSTWPRLLPSTRIDFLTEAGDLSQNSAVMAAVLWIGRTFPEAPLVVLKRTTPHPQEIPDHPLTLLLRQPNTFYNGLLLWQATLLSYNIAGNAYWLKVRNGTGKVVEVWYEPDFTCRPVWPVDGSVFISGYQVKRQGQWRDVRTEDVVHFRMGLDPRNPRLGLSPLASALREVFTDNEAANFSASLLRNMGIPGVVLSPASADVTIDDPEGLKTAMVSKFSGDRRGEPLVMQGPTKIEVLSFSPEQMNYQSLRRIPEERVSALLGIPPIVTGLGAGWDKSSYNNYKTAVEAAYRGNLLPTQRLLAAVLTTDLLPDVAAGARGATAATTQGAGAGTEYVAFDTSEVQALAEDQDAKAKRLVTLYRGGLLRRDESRRAWDPALPTDAADSVYITDIISARTLTERVSVNEVATPGTDVADVGQQPEGGTGKSGNGHNPEASGAVLAAAGKES